MINQIAPPQNGQGMADDFKMEFDIGTIKHLGLQMYSTLPPVIGELVSNAWDADAEAVEITIPTGPITENAEIIVQDFGGGMSDRDVRNAYLVVGRDRRKDDGDCPTPTLGRKVMGRKGIGKLSAFGIATEIEIETIKDSQTSRFVMNYAEFEQNAGQRGIRMPSLPPTGTVTKGTKITLRGINKFRNRSINIQGLRRGLARRFSIIGDNHRFSVSINGNPITPQERDLKLLLDKDTNGGLYLWSYNDVEIKPETGWKVNGWIGALDRTKELGEGIQRGIVVMARGKMVQEPFVFDATVGQQFALSYLVGELEAAFVDEKEDTIGTTRNSLVWDAEANAAFKEWGQKEVNKVAREWAQKRSNDNETELLSNPVYIKFTQEANQYENKQIRQVADKLIRQIINNNPIASMTEQQPVIQMCLDFMEFDAFNELAQEMSATDVGDVGKLIQLFRDWEIIEAKEMMRVTKGRITTIEKLRNLIDTNALEVPTLHRFLKEFPWVLDPRWTLVADEKFYSRLLRDEFPQSTETLEQDKRIDFLCVKESSNLVVIEIKRPKSSASNKELEQIEEYVGFMREHVLHTTDPDMKFKDVTGYLLCGRLVDTRQVRQKKENLAKAGIYIRLYSDLLRMVENSHQEFLERYDKLSEVKKKAYDDNLIQSPEAHEAALT